MSVIYRKTKCVCIKTVTVGTKLAVKRLKTNKGLQLFDLHFNKLEA